MLSLNRKTDYALAAMADLARRGSAVASARDLAGRLKVPLPALTNILNRLRHCGLVRSVRGASGGYTLAKQPGDITLAELIEAVEGPVRLTRCCSDTLEVESQKCDREDSCELREPMHMVHASFRDFLSRVTLRDLAWNRVPLNLAHLNPMAESLGNGGPQE